MSPYKFSPLHKFNFILNGVPDRSEILAGYYFEKGFFHACTSLAAANIVLNQCRNTYRRELLFSLSKLELPKLETSFNYDFIIVEAYIPRFTRYAIEEDIDHICSRCLILKM